MTSLPFLSTTGKNTHHKRGERNCPESGMGIGDHTPDAIPHEMRLPCDHLGLKGAREGQKEWWTSLTTS
jgi:hypothetical protein